MVSRTPSPLTLARTLRPGKEIKNWSPILKFAFVAIQVSHAAGEVDGLLYSPVHGHKCEPNGQFLYHHHEL